MTYRYWPLFDLRLSTPDLSLRPMTEADLGPIATCCPRTWNRTRGWRAMTSVMPAWRSSTGSETMMAWFLHL